MFLWNFYPQLSGPVRVLQAEPNWGNSLPCLRLLAAPGVMPMSLLIDVTKSHQMFNYPDAAAKLFSTVFFFVPHLFVYIGTSTTPSLSDLQCYIWLKSTQIFFYFTINSPFKSQWSTNLQFLFNRSFLLQSFMISIGLSLMVFNLKIDVCWFCLNCV